MHNIVGGGKIDGRVMPNRPVMDRAAKQRPVNRAGSSTDQPDLWDAVYQFGAFNPERAW
ncbi:MAG: hypothetical protein AAF702_40335 [Chloroflexota bacterium]